jgi:2-haloacid dehalogenase
MAQGDVAAVKALTFDVFGTVVDWRGSIIRQGEKFAAEHGLSVDWAAFADAWRGAYRPSMDRVRRGELPWTNLDTLHRMVLDELLVKFGITGLSEADIDHLNRVWHRLDPWPDSVEGLSRLRKRFVLATLSNGTWRY